MIGKILGRNRILEKLGEGGMGAVYRAQDEHLDRHVAVKILPPDSLADDSARRRFRKEALALSKLSHPNIETVFDFDTQENIDYLVLEYIQGATLRAVLAKGPLSEKEVTRLGMQMAEGLAAAHEHGVVHCDLKPGNLMVTPDGRLKILDFGLAKLSKPEISEESTTSSAEPGKARGTLPYMAPEQLRGETVDQRTDIYALGNILYEMAAGRLPFQETLSTALVHDILSKAPPPPGRLRPELSTWLEEVILKCLEKDPENRYQSAKEILIDLRRHSVSEISRPAVELPAKPRRLSWRSALAVLVAAAALLAAWQFWPGSRGGASVPDYTPLAIRNRPFWEGEPAISPDGKWIVYASYESGKRNIYVNDLNDQAPRQLTNGPDEDSEPAWFPDSSAIAFTREIKDENQNIRQHIYRIPVMGGAAARLLEDAKHPAFSPDESRMAFCRNLSGERTQIGIIEFDKKSANPSEERMLTETEEISWAYLDPTWSPDGQTICYAGRLGLRKVPAKGGAQQPVMLSEGRDFEPVWSAASRKIYFSSYRDGTLALWWIPEGGGKPERLTEGRGQESHPSLSKDGKMLIHAADTSHRRLMLLDRTSRKPPRPVPEKDWETPAISPDKKSMVFSMRRSGFPMQLATVPLVDGYPSGQPTILLSLPDHAVLPAFSPDGKVIAYQNAFEKKSHICIVPSSGGRSTRIQYPGTFNGQPAWSTDGTRIALVSNRSGSTQIWLDTIENGTPCGTPWKLTHGDYEAYLPAWSANSERIAFLGCGKTSHCTLYVIASDGKSAAMPLIPGQEIRLARWDNKTGKLLVSANWKNEGVSLQSLDPDKGVPQPFQPALDFIAPGSMGPISVGFFSISNDGDLLVYSQENLNGIIWLLKATNGVF